MSSSESEWAIFMQLARPLYTFHFGNEVYQLDVIPIHNLKHEISDSVPQRRGPF